MKKTIFEKFGSGLSREQMKNVKGGDAYGFDSTLCGNDGIGLFNCTADQNGIYFYGTTCANSAEEAVALNADNWPPPYPTAQNVTCYRIG